MEVSDITILKIYSRDKHKGLELLYERYKKYIYGIAANYAGSREDALDITQEVFISVFKNLDRFKEGFSLLPWLRRITVNKCLNHITNKKAVNAKGMISLNQTNEEGDEMQSLLRSDENTESEVLLKDTKKTLEKAIRLLPDRERMAVILRHMKGMKYEEIASIMDLPIGTVKTFLYRARTTIREKLVNDGVWEV